MDWKSKIALMIADYIRLYEAESGTAMRWKPPLVGFADARSPEFETLKRVVHKEHALPQDILMDASMVVSYFLPYPENIAWSNRDASNSVENGDNLCRLEIEHHQTIAFHPASSTWAMAYRETNILFGKLNDYLRAELIKLDQSGQPAETTGRKAVQVALPLSAASMDSTTLTSRWSQRHVARIAGLGTFGVNNMLLTESGCCGRFSSFVTDLDTTADSVLNEDNCLYRRSGAISCGLCVKRCPSTALTLEGFDRFLCGKVCDINQAVHDPDLRLGTDSAVCGKCLIDLPCSFCRP